MTFAASKAQRLKCSKAPCASCGMLGPSDPAHLCSRAQGGCDSPLCVIPLCRRCHTEFDTRGKDLLPLFGERTKWTAERAHMARHMDPIKMIRRLSGTRWVPEPPPHLFEAA